MKCFNVDESKEDNMESILSGVGPFLHRKKTVWVEESGLFLFFFLLSFFFFFFHFFLMIKKGSCDY